MNDPYVKAAIAQGWRSRAAFKLIELDDRLSLIAPRARVNRSGRRPRRLSQVALSRGAARVIGIDLLKSRRCRVRISSAATSTTPAPKRPLTTLIGGRAELVLSDMAPNTTGHAATDHLRIMALAALALDFATRTLVPGGTFVARFFKAARKRKC